MKRIVIAKSKGGVGGSTLTFNLAVFAAIDAKSKVYLVDCDPQRSVERMWDKRNELINPRLIKDVDSVPEALKLYEENYDRDYAFIDTPSSMMHAITDAISAANLVVVPTQISPVDQWAQDAVLDRINRIWPPSKLVFVLTRVSSATAAEIKEAKRYWHQFSPHPIGIMFERKDYKRAAGIGKAGWEVADRETSIKIKAEINEIWKIILKALAGSTEQSNVVSIAR